MNKEIEIRKLVIKTFHKDFGNFEGQKDFYSHKICGCY
jgi:hypothetical protein